MLAKTIVIADERPDVLEALLGDVPALEVPFNVAYFFDVVGLWAAREPTFFSGLGREWVAHIRDLVTRGRPTSGG